MAKVERCQPRTKRKHFFCLHQLLFIVIEILKLCVQQCNGCSECQNFDVLYYMTFNSQLRVIHKTVKCWQCYAMDKGNEKVILLIKVAIQRGNKSHTWDLIDLIVDTK